MRELAPAGASHGACGVRSLGIDVGQVGASAESARILRDHVTREPSQHMGSHGPQQLDQQGIVQAAVQQHQHSTLD